MNSSHSAPELSYLPRWITTSVQSALEAHPVLVLTGARQVGKSTFLRHALPTRQWRYITFDDLDAIEQAERDPESLWAGTQQVVFDEVQRVPALLSAVKRVVDVDRRHFRAVLSGSANLLLMQRVSETLAGRAVYVTLWPMTVGEAAGRPAPSLLPALFKGQWPSDGVLNADPIDPLALATRGFMPPLLDLRGQDGVVRWWEGYVATYLERDLRHVSRVESLTDFKHVMEAVALRSGQLVHQSDIARETGVSQPSVHRYLNLLETTCVMQRVPAFARNRTKRLVKTPKIYCVDAGLATHLAGYFSYEAVQHARERGGFFETVVLQHLRALAQLLTPQPAICYWRTTSGHEVDFVLEQGRQLIAVEVKMTARPHQADCEGLRQFLHEYPEACGGVLAHTGRRIQRMGNRLIAIPWTLLGTS